MLRTVVILVLLLCGTAAAALWLVSRNGEKIIYLDTGQEFAVIHMVDSIGWRGVLLQPVGDPTEYALCLTLDHGMLVVRCLELGEVSGPLLALFSRGSTRLPAIVGITKWKLPLWPVFWTCVPLAVVLWATPAARRQVRRRRNRCVGCGYPLRGLTSNRCPECGRSFPAGEAGG